MERARDLPRHLWSATRLEATSLMTIPAFPNPPVCIPVVSSSYPSSQIGPSTLLACAYIPLVRLVSQANSNEPMRARAMPFLPPSEPYITGTFRLVACCSLVPCFAEFGSWR
jgi:hypothetical protein